MNLKTLPAGKQIPDDINVVIEIPSGSSVKYELDAATGVINVDRFLFTASFYPFNYGFIPSTHAADGDPLDVIVLSSYPVTPGSVIRCQPIALLEMEDEAGKDEKIVAVPLAKIDAIYGQYQSVAAIPEAIKNKIKHFFETYKTLEPNKWVKINNWQDVEFAKKAISASLITKP